MSVTKIVYPSNLSAIRRLNSFNRTNRKVSLAEYLLNSSYPRNKLSQKQQRSLTKLNKKCKIDLKRNSKKKHKLTNKQISGLKKSILKSRKLRKSNLNTNKSNESLANAFANISISNNNLEKPQHRKPEQPKQKLHTSRFRSYCENMITAELILHTKNFLTKLNTFQSRAHDVNPIKAAANRRFIIGLRGINNYLIIRKICMLIFATDCENDNEENEGSLRYAINLLKKEGHNQNIPIVYCFRRRELAHILHVKNIISCVGIINISGVEEIYKDLLNELQRAQALYVEKANLFKSETSQDNKNVKVLLDSFDKMSI